MKPLEALISLALVGAVTFVVFLIARELMCWYWKINEGLAKLAALEGILRNIDKNLADLTNLAENAQPATQQREEA